MTDNALPLPADFGLVRMPGLVGAGIRFGQFLYDGTFTDFEHAFIYLGAGRIAEAMPGGAIEVPLSVFGDNPIMWSTGHDWDWTNEADQRDKIVEAARGYLGTPYSFADYLAMASHRAHLPVPGLKKYVANSKHMLCSQYVDQCYADAGVQLFKDGRWPGYVAPSGLEKLLTG